MSIEFASRLQTGWRLFDVLVARLLEREQKIPFFVHNMDVSTKHSLLFLTHTTTGLG